MSHDEKVQSLPFRDDITLSSSASSPAAHIVESAGAKVPGPRLDSDGPDPNLDAMTNEQLRAYVYELKTSRDRQPHRVVRLFDALGIMAQRGILGGPRVRLDLVADAPPAVKVGGRKARARRFYRLLRRVTPDAGTRMVEALAEWLADDLYDAASVGDFRRICKALREGVLTRELISKGYRRAKRPGIRSPSACFRRFIWDRWPGAIARAHAVTVTHSQG